jgi:phosphonatase-like hydrolase
MLPIELIVFDLAGTTVKDDGSIAVAFQHAMAAYQYHIPDEEVYPLMGYHKPLAIQMMLEKFEPDTRKITDDFISEIHSRFQKEMIRYYESVPVLSPLPFAEDLFRKLKDHEVKVGLNTGFSRAIADTIMERLGWMKNGLANYLVASNEVPAGRPHPYMIEKMMKKAGINDPRKVIKVGDTEVDVMEGKNTGCLLSIAVTTGAFSREALIPYAPDYIIDNLGELDSILWGN